MNTIYLFKPFRELNSTTSRSCDNCLSWVTDDVSSGVVGCEEFGK